MIGDLAGSTVRPDLPIGHALSGLGLSDSALRSILNRGSMAGPDPLPPARRRALRSRWEAHHETLSRGIDRILEAIRSQDQIPVWPLGKAYWMQLLHAEHSGYGELMRQVDAELLALGV